MNKMAFVLALAFLLLAACNGNSGGPPADSTPPPAERPPEGGLSSLAVERAFENLTFTQPVEMVQRPGDEERWYLLEKAGRVRTFTAQDSGAADTLDLRESVQSGPSEAGLLGIAFHPQFETNGAVFLSYTAGTSQNLVSRISRFTSPDGGLTIDPASEQILLSLDQPFGNHNGGQIAFGPDGHLYIGFGDGGSGGDPQGHGQNKDTLLGAILRIDVNASQQDRSYGIPPGNPFVQGGGAAEIYAWGLRNPWRFGFDRETGLLWAADVGQNAWEEVNIIEAGGNYGWNIREGAHCYPPNIRTCPTEGLIDPVTEYPNASGDCSITGGYVYRGDRIPSLQGTYLFGDFCSGKIWGLPLDQAGRPAAPHQVLVESNLGISSFAQGHDGEVYILDFGGGTIHRLVQRP